MNLSANDETRSPLMPRHPTAHANDARAAYTRCRKQQPPLPPSEIAVVKRTKRFSLGAHKVDTTNLVENKSSSALYSNSLNGITGSSGRSIASSITFTELDVDEEDISGLMAAIHLSEKLYGSNDHLDSSPFIPRRQDSVKKISCDTSVDNDVREEATQITDSPPTKPRRSLSFNSTTSNELAALALRKADLFANKSDQFRPKQATRRGTNRKLPPGPPLTSLKGLREVDIELLSHHAAIFLSIVEVKDRKHGMIKFKKCFVGAEAVDRMIESGLAATRKEAVEFGRQMMRKCSLFKHVTGTQTFKDKHLFYRFCDDRTEKRFSAWFPKRGGKSRATNENKSYNREA